MSPSHQGHLVADIRCFCSFQSNLSACKTNISKQNAHCRAMSSSVPSMTHEVYSEWCVKAAEIILAARVDSPSRKLSCRIDDRSHGVYAVESFCLIPQTERSEDRWMGASVYGFAMTSGDIYFLLSVSFGFQFLPQRGFAPVPDWLLQHMSTRWHSHLSFTECNCHEICNQTEWDLRRDLVLASLRVPG